MLHGDRSLCHQRTPPSSCQAQRAVPCVGACLLCKLQCMPLHSRTWYLRSKTWVSVCRREAHKAGAEDDIDAILAQLDREGKAAKAARVTPDAPPPGPRICCVWLPTGDPVRLAPCKMRMRTVAKGSQVLSLVGMILLHVCVLCTCTRGPCRSACLWQLLVRRLRAVRQRMITLHRFACICRAG